MTEIKKKDTPVWWSDLQGHCSRSMAVLQQRLLLFFSFRKKKVLFHFASLPKKRKRVLVFESLKPEVSLEKLSIHSAGRYSCSTDRYLCAILNLANLGTNTTKSVISLEFGVDSTCLAKMLSTATSKISQFSLQLLNPSGSTTQPR